MATLNYHSPESTPRKPHSGFGVAAAVCGGLFLSQAGLMVVTARAGDMPAWLGSLPAVGVAFTFLFTAIILAAIGVLLPGQNRWLPAFVLFVLLTSLLLLLMAWVSMFPRYGIPKLSGLFLRRV